ncbi:asparagine synthase (glutamine-hydrolyzing) [Micromonospora andamanensis]|uniref:asparagine synthase (glutamine-hydrolyzing) n=1 Tax=Micromonospora andamanensis TaxID=1287068 RepID=A0ABQ4I4D1_9ACTN|nr:asparagine synthase (glutamine-hydrolyzing) [Micromonospora andamanensis]GIJ12732.1 asparagine synthetase B [Micromonospora andamanensis]
MCGIAGVLRFASGGSSVPGVDEIRAVTAGLAHRGPDGGDVWHRFEITLGHRRLSILDLTGHGTQPMTRDHLTLVYNGELYNFADLRSHLQRQHCFQSGTDTEVVLRAWQQWGPAALDRFDGMFAFALWDDRARQLHLVRDRLGVKPLYYHRGNGFLIFASEVEALLCCPQVPRRPNLGAFYSQLLCSSTLQVDRQLTLVDQVHALPPATHLTLDHEGSETTHTYWQLPSQTAGQRPAEALPELGALFQRSVTSMLVADVPVAAFLSGGLDSSAITAKAAATGPLTAITLTHTTAGCRRTGDTADVDLRFSKLLAAHTGQVTHRIAACPSTVTLDDVDTVCDLAAIGDDVRHVSIAHNYRMVRNLGLKVVLNGQGADETMGGYVSLPTFVDHILDVRQPSAATINSLPGSRQTAGLTSEVLAHRERMHERVLDFHAGLPGTPLERAHRLLVHTQLNRVVQFEDHLSMRFGVESRVPFLDHHLVEWCFTLPFDHHVDLQARQGKAILRAALTGTLPAALLARPKQVFPHPEPATLHRSLAALVRLHAAELYADPLVNHLFTLPPANRLSALPTKTLWLLLTTWRWHHKLQRPHPDPASQQPTTSEATDPDLTSHGTSARRVPAPRGADERTQR